MSRFVESVVEDAALAWLEGLGWRGVHGPDIAPAALAGERRLRCGRAGAAALARRNQALPAEALDDAFCKLTTG